MGDHVFSGRFYSCSSLSLSNRPDVYKPTTLGPDNALASDKFRREIDRGTGKRPVQRQDVHFRSKVDVDSVEKNRGLSKAR